MRDRLLTLLKVAISLGLIAYICTRPTILGADWDSILSKIRPGPWALALAVYFASIGLNVLKWQCLLHTLGMRVPYRSLFRHNLVGLFFANLPLSMIGGDIARGWDLARSNPEQSAQVAVSVLMDRLIGMAAFLTAGAAGLAFAVLGLRRYELIWLLATTAAILAALVLVACVMLSQRLRRFMERLFQPKLLRPLLPLYLRLSDSVQLYRTNARSVLVAYGLGLATVAGTCVVNYLGAITVGAKVPLAWVLILTPLTPFAIYIPSIASGLGVNQAVFVALYHNLTDLIPQPEALAWSLAMQVIIYMASLPGAVLWWRRRETRRLSARQL
ncbi:MAG: flippase-like domain-containing protein [Anaerolineae bacterium]|nr:flippase-like domain-containing protein [Anaerolineae bacterium]